MAQKKSINIEIILDELVFDILNETYLRGRSLRNADNHKEVASLQASMDEEDHDKIMRAIKKGYSEIKIELAEYLNETANTTDNKLIADDGVLEINLAMPSNYNESATVGLGEAIHNYIKNIAVADWYLVTNKAESTDYLTLAAASLVNVQQSLTKRSRPQRRY